MKTLQAPEVEGFTPTKAYRVLNVNFLRLASADGVRLDLSETGAAEVGCNPEVAALLDRMGDFIAKHDGYRDVSAVKTAEPGGILRVGDKKPNRRGAFNLASVYHHESAPMTIVKAYDFDHMSAAPQFYFGAWLHERLAGAEAGLHSPEQLAMFTAPSGHRTVVMEYLPQTTLRAYGHLKDANARDTTARAIRTAVHERLAKTLSRQGLLVTNDLIDANIMLDDADRLITPDNVAEQEFGIIDQPVVRWRNAALFSLVQGLSRRRYQPLEQPVLAMPPQALPEYVA
ncbi:MAG TPA: hypothetical protein VMU97_02800 [Candidatus Dormibacteraeota bacterium]|nr:hypothetical protein [Candidatus Dormibacteraeota bacterium]